MKKRIFFAALLLALTGSGPHCKAATIQLSSDTWWGTTTIYDDVEILAGATLTITNSQTIDIRGNLTVMPGGKLVMDIGSKMLFTSGKFLEVQAAPTYLGTPGTIILDNATIEKADINVLGMNGLNQFYAAQVVNSNGRVVAATAIFKNGTKLVSCKVRNYKPYDNQLPERTLASGGIINATQTHFDHSLLVMKNQMASKKNDRSAFNRCIFYGHARITMELVEGLIFQGCTFDGTTGTDPTNRESGTIVRAMNAGFIIKDHCSGGWGGAFIGSGSGWYGTGCGSATVDRTEIRNYRGQEEYFYNSQTGKAMMDPFIEAQCTDGRVHVLDIEHTKWTCNIYAMRITGYSMPMIIGNELIYNTAATTPSSFNAYAQLVDVIGSPHIIVEDNIYDGVYGQAVYAGPGSKYRPAMGILVADLGGLENEVYKNSVHDALYAFEGIGKNRNASGSSGLKYLCNDLQDVGMDGFLIAENGYPKNPATTVATSGIRQTQDLVSGSSTYPTGNTFATVLLRFNNPAANPIDYYYKAGNTNEDITSSLNTNINVIPISNAATCPSKNWHDIQLTYKTDVFGQAGGTGVGSTIYAEYMTSQLAYIMIGSSDGMDVTAAEQLFIDDNNYPEYKILLAQSYATENNYTDAINTLDAISGQFTLTTEEQTNIDNLVTAYQVGKHMFDTDGDWSTLDNGLKTGLYDIAINDQGYARYMAQGYLTQYESMQYEPVYIWDETGSEKQSTAVKASKMKQNVISPNPLQDKMRITLNSPVKHNARVSIVDMFGRQVYGGQIDQGINEVNTSKLSTGLYMVYLYADDVMVQVDKLSKL